MAFWSNTAKLLEPTRKRNFIVRIKNNDFFIAKSVTRPTIEAEVSEFLILNHTFKIPTIKKYQDVTMKFVETTNLSALRTSLGILTNGNLPSSGSPNAEGLSKSDGIDISIDSYDDSGKLYDSWTLMGAFVKSISAGEMSYESDEFVEIEVVVSYDYAVYEIASSSTASTTAALGNALSTAAAAATATAAGAGGGAAGDTGGRNNLPPSPSPAPPPTGGGTSPEPEDAIDDELPADYDPDPASTMV